jgi:hypothetical protein
MIIHYSQPFLPDAVRSDITSLFALGSDYVFDAGILHHFRAAGMKDAVAAIALPNEAATWREEISANMTRMSPEAAYWYGFDVGFASACLFSVLAKPNHCSKDAARFAGARVPQDSDEFAQCVRLLELFPDWKSQLHKVAEKHPLTAWPTIIGMWSELSSLRMKPEDRTALLGILQRQNLVS